MTALGPITVLGGGSFGTALANLLGENGHDVLQWMRDPAQAEHMRVHRQNPRYQSDMQISARVLPTTDIGFALQRAQTVFVALPSSALRQVLRPQIALLRGKAIISTTKGLEADTFLLMSQIIESLVPEAHIGALSGPNLASEILENALTATVIASADAALCRQVQALLHGSTFRVYASSDRFGVEMAGALKNVYAIMAGLAAARGMGQNTRSLLITRALAEMTRFAVTLGAHPLTFMGLAGVGDLLVTCSSERSRNFQVGFALGSGLNLEQAVARLGGVAEGVNTLRVLKPRAAQLGVYMPLVTGLHAILFEGGTLEAVIARLMSAEPKTDVDFISTHEFQTPMESA